MMNRNLKLGDFMTQKTMAGLAALALVSAASAGAETVVARQAQWCHNQDGTRAECRDLRRDTRDIRVDEKELATDRREIRQDVRTGQTGEVRSDRRGLRQGRRDLNKDTYDRRHDVRNIPWS